MKTFHLTLAGILILLTTISGCKQAQPVLISQTNTPLPSPSHTITTTPKTVQGNASISGHILASFGAHQAMAKLPLSVDGLTSTAVTEDVGAFTLKDLPVGTWTVRGKTLTFSVTISKSDQTNDLGYIKYPLEQLPVYYTKPVTPVDDLNALMMKGKYFDWRRPC